MPEVGSDHPTGGIRRSLFAAVQQGSLAAGILHAARFGREEARQLRTVRPMRVPLVCEEVAGLEGVLQGSTKSFSIQRVPIGLSRCCSKR